MSCNDVLLLWGVCTIVGFCLGFFGSDLLDLFKRP